MALFELDNGRLVPAQFGRTVAGGFTPEVVNAVRAQILEVIARPLFPITWKDVTGDAKPGQPPRLTALDAAGQVVGVEVLDELDAEGLIDALSKLADTAAMSWSDLARQYPKGTAAFKEDWVRFREAMPTSPPNGPRMILVAAEISEDVRPALDVLSSSGVEVHEMSLRQMRNGRAFLEVDTVGHRLYTHRFVPVLEGQEDLPAIAAMAAGQAPSVGRPTLGPPASAASPDQPAHLDDDERAPERTPERAAGEAKTPDVLARRAQRTPAHSAPTGDGEIPAWAQAGAQPTGKAPKRKKSRRRKVAATTGLPSRRDVHGTASREPAVVPGEESAKALKKLGRMLGASTPLVLAGGLPTPQGAALTTAGEILLPPHAYTDPTEALAAAGVEPAGPTDGWDAWVIYDEQGPTLGEALAEVS